MKQKLLFFYPFIVSIYPILFLYSKNIQEYSESAFLIPAFVSLIFGGIVFGICKLIFKKLDQAAITSSFIIFISLSYGRFVSFADTKNVSGIFVFVLFILLLSIVVYFVRKHKEHLLSVNKFLLFLSCFLLIVPLFTIAQFELKTGRIFKNLTTQEKTQTTKNTKPETDTPDIYYFIFDRYAGPTSQRNEYGVDNSKFFNFLKDKGFYLAEDATTNYPKTFLSLGSTLNMEYLDFLTKQTNGGGSPDESIVTPLIRESRVHQYLKNKGYTLINIGPKTWGPTSNNPYADINFIIQKGTYPYADPFATGFYNTTIAEPILKKIFQDPNDVSKDPNNNEHRRIALYQLGAVEEAVKIKGPMFVFAHILLPHDPFVFDKNCNPIAETEVKKHDLITNYTNQLTCTNTKMEHLMSYILKNSAKPPVIILQSDEGPFPMKDLVDDKQSWSKATDRALHEKFPILDAYYFPNKKTEQLYQSITPVNSFRILFNTYFGENYPLLEDKNYIFQDEENFYKFTDVTDRVRN